MSQSGLALHSGYKSRRVRQTQKEDGFSGVFERNNAEITRISRRSIARVTNLSQNYCAAQALGLLGIIKIIKGVVAMRNVVQKTGWLASSALLLTALPSVASSNGLCGPSACVLVANIAGDASIEVFYTPDAIGGTGFWTDGLTPISDLGGADWQPLVVDWDSDGDDDLAVYKDGVFLIDLNKDGFGAVPIKTYTLPASVPWGANSIPVAGNWDGLGGDDLGIYTDGVFTLFPDSTDLTDTITVDFGDMPQNSGYAYTQMPFSGPIDDDQSGIARVGIYFGNYAQYAPETIDSTYDFYDVRYTDAAITTYHRPHFYARPAVVDVSQGTGSADHRLVFMMPPGLAELDESACTNHRYSCLSLYPDRPDSQQPVVTPPPDAFN